ncbi:toxin-antitoxin system HicB family antitoxin [Pseudorhodoferax soli]|uniref:toxin-antitoxin system HicB family antitoxin n=1 Tax=Pseudorhodoferax soli TaxID=545864 RepID=UPI000DF387B4|nr:Arc family DNA-binding protein [Pseudorhodoferax soli]
MEEEDRYTRITLRLPKELHARLGDAAAATSKSVNAEIVARLHDASELEEESERNRRLRVQLEIEREHIRERLEATSKAMDAEAKRSSELQSEVLKLRALLDSERMRQSDMERSVLAARRELEEVRTRSDSAELVQALKSAIAAKDELLAGAKRSQEYWAEQVLQCADRFRAAYQKLSPEGQAEPLFIAEYEKSMSNIFLARQLLMVRSHRPHPDELIRFTPLNEVRGSDEAKAYQDVLSRPKKP